MRTLPDRRTFLKASLAAAAAAWPIELPAFEPRIRFAAVGLNHSHIHGQIYAVTRGGSVIAALHAKEPDSAADFAKRYPAAKQARTEREILEDDSIKLIVSAAIPNERAALGVEAMRHGKDVMVDKPGTTTLDQLAALR